MKNAIQTIFQRGFSDYSMKYYVSNVQRKAANDIMLCRTDDLGTFTYTCDDCGHIVTRPCSCKNRHCPYCQTIPRAQWIDARKSEVFPDSQYFHIVMTVPHQLLPLFFRNQKELYSLFHRCSSQAIIELSQSIHGMGGTPAVTQLLHTWGQQLNFHPHLHCIVSGTGLSSSKKLVRCKEGYLFPLPMLMDLFRGKFLSHLNLLYLSGDLELPDDIPDHLAWLNLMDKLYSIDWCPYIKETFNGNGNAIDYLGRYTYRVAITESRIEEVTDTHVTFRYYDYKTATHESSTITIVEFIRRFLMHILPKGIQKTRHSGLLNNRFKSRNLNILSTLLKEALRHARLKGLKVSEIILVLWNIDVTLCPQCKGHNLKLSALPFHQKL